jgi:SecD/SecF fusion protein
MKRFDFIGPKVYWFTFSLLIILAGVVGYFVKGVEFGIEFKGGTSFDLAFEKPVASVEDVRAVLASAGYKDSIVQKVETKKNEFIIRTVSVNKEEEEAIKDKLDKAFGIAEEVSVKTVSPTWGSQITRSALFSLLIAIGLILAYVTIRLDFKMAIVSVVALVHDVLVTLAIYILVGREITPATVAAILTLLGYSLYDTIVVFHRINENAKQIGKRTFAQMANDSIHQVFMRWVNTLVTTLIPIICIFFFGGETLKDFAFALLVGVASGGYSSLFIAAPLYSLWKETEPYYANLKKKFGTAAA